MTRRAIAGILLVCAAALTAYAAVPTSITVQGKLTDLSGNPLPAGAKNFTFKIFSAAVGGGQFWPDAGGENQVITTATDGTWIGLVGAVIPILPDAFADTSRWLEITVDGTTLPRVRLVTGPYAYRVGTVDGASGGTIKSKVAIGEGHFNVGFHTFVAGFDNNVDGDFSSVTGGQSNSATGQFSHISGGQNDTAFGDYSAIVGGQNNLTVGSGAFVGGGVGNRSTAEGAVIAGGASNRASGVYSFVGGGGGALPDSNTASGSWSSVVGGSHNVASGLTAFVGGGSGNIAKSGSAAIVGGQNNRADTGNTFIGGGRDNHVDQVDAIIGGGWMNEALGNTSAILGGRSNVASGAGSAIVGGATNRARGAFSFVGGGGGTTAADSNLALGDLSTVAGGRANLATGSYSFIGGGQSNVATQLEATIGGGNGNRAAGTAATVAGGRADTALGNFSTIGGGIRNWCFGQSTTIGGGSENRTDADYATIGGGLRNFAAFAGTVGGGQSNLATATNGATIAGGTSNTADGSFSTIGGGYNNYTYGTSATVSGGGGSADADSNVARGLGATIPGGRRNRANGSFSFAAGRRAHALHHGTFVWADSTEADFASTAQDQFLIRAAGGVGIGTNAPEGPWHVQKGSAGAVTANSNSIAVFETSSSNGWISILGTDNAERGLLFTEPSNAVAGAIVFDQGGGGNDIGFRTGGNVTNMTLDASGNLTVSGCVDGNNTACASDERFKTNIATVDDALAIVGRLRGVRYQWRANEFPERHFEPGAQYGVIAQEVREVLPELIRTREDGYLSVEYNGLIPLLIEGMKEQQRQIDELKTALRALTP
ncbi:MAG TPA: tail fiber domain-containing protein [bacterium]|nr:tail fiber domain-containing protein [bacterium]